MRVYKISKIDFEEKVINDDASSPAWFMEFDGNKHFLSNWTIPHFSKINESKPLEDLVYTNPLILNKRAIDILMPIIKEQGEVLPVAIDNEEYYILNCTNPIDALDESMCIKKPVYKGSEDMIYYRYCFDKEKVSGNHFFTIVNDNMIDTYADDEIKAAVEANSLTGFKFHLIWGEDIDYELLDAEKNALQNRESYYKMVLPASKELEKKIAEDYEISHKITGTPYGWFTICIFERINKFRKDRILPKEAQNTSTFAYYLAIQLGDDIRFYNLWKWVEIVEDGHKKLAIASEDDSYSFFIVEYINDMLEKEYSDENEIMNMYDRICRLKPGEKKYMPIY